MSAQEQDGNRGRTLAFGEMLKSRRVKSELTQMQLADKLSVTGPLISQYENGKRLPSTRILSRIRRALDLSADEFAFMMDVVE